MFVTGSHDRSLRVWERTREMMNPDEEREAEREQAYEQQQEEQDCPVYTSPSPRASGASRMPFSP